MVREKKWTDAGIKALAGPEPLTEADKERLKAEGKNPDARRAVKHRIAENLFLAVWSTGRRTWSFRYSRRGKACELGLGPYPDTSLKEALAEGAKLCLALSRGEDPADAKQREKLPTFKEYYTKLLADGVIGGHWRNPKGEAQFTSSLEAYAKEIHDLPIDQITTADVVRCLEPIWQRIPETASRVQGRLETVLSAAKGQKLRTGDNPASWEGALRWHLPKRVIERKHHPSLPHQRIHEFMAALKAREAIAASALRFAVLTAARSGEVLGATWEEFDLTPGAELWEVPAARMKAKREHVVPLSPEAVAILTEMKPIAKTVEGKLTGPVFPGRSKGGALSGMALEMLLRRIEPESGPIWVDASGAGIVPHGFRATFKTWAGDTTDFPREDVELSLAHRFGNAVEQAYYRGQALERRRLLMTTWATYCTRPVDTADGDQAEAAE